ncbi:MAG TPA: TetR/AcrR family transcriptional regulator [Phycisphaerales bacterium]|nr:TetR/AcrR family transcriptional regulator [Phycisphaerales bacterium]
MQTRERLVRAAYEVFLQQGFNAVGIDQVLQKVGVTKTTFYNHFESKDDLVAAVLQWRNAQWPRALKKVFEDAGETDAAERLVLLLRQRDEIWELPKGGTGLFTRAACEYPAGQGPVRQAIAEYRATLEKELLSITRATGAADPEALMREIKLVLAGVAGMNLVGDTERVNETAVHVARQVIERHLVSAPKKKAAKAPPKKKKR